MTQFSKKPKNFLYLYSCLLSLFRISFYFLSFFNFLLSPSPPSTNPNPKTLHQPDHLLPSSYVGAVEVRYPNLQKTFPFSSLDIANFFSSDTSSLFSGKPNPQNYPPNQFDWQYLSQKLSTN
jgi:hypothetical protein